MRLQYDKITDRMTIQQYTRYVTIRGPLGLSLTHVADVSARKRKLGSLCLDKGENEINAGKSKSIQTTLLCMDQLSAAGSDK